MVIVPIAPCQGLGGFHERQGRGNGADAAEEAPPANYGLELGTKPRLR